ncbi:MAG: efflux RND transporter periplasmic adaptor subunit [bacterium]|nr:efflux RND transporter periplasmic adaptor subunit [bacterium]
MKKIFKIGLIAAVIVAIGVWFFGFRGNKETIYEYALAERRDVVKEVSVTGKVKPGADANLAFEQSGKITGIYVVIGNPVVRGEAIASIYSADIAAKLAQAQAGVKSEEAKLNDLLKGAREEEINVQKAKVENKKVLFEEAERNMMNVISDSYTKSDDAVRNKVDQFISNPKSASPKLNFSLADQQREDRIENNRVSMESLLILWQESLVELSVSTGNLDFYVSEAKTNLDKIKNFLDDVSFAVNSLTSNASFSQATIDGYKNDISTARNNINMAISNISAAQEKLSNAATFLSLEERELELDLAGASQENISVQEAALAKAQALVNQYEAELSKTVLRSPVSGVISKLEIEIGETVSPGEIVASVISLNKFKIEANVPEVDIAGLKSGNMAEVILDAYGDEALFLARVLLVDPAETIVEGVPTYKTTLVFEQDDARIKSGMTANVEIKIDEKKDVIAVAQRAISQEGGKSFIKILNDAGMAETVEVKTGMRGSDGFVEITEGAQEGDKVVIFEKQ